MRDSEIKECFLNDDQTLALSAFNFQHSTSLMNSPLKTHCQTKLQEIEAAGLLRQIQKWENIDTRTIQSQGRTFLNFSSNDYLGISSRSELREISKLNPFESSGATASRLITGNHAAYELLESRLANFKKVESSLVFSSGYAAALGTIPALVGVNDFIVMDKLCHASLVDGARLSGATLRIFPHNNMKRCAELLATCRFKSKEANILIITESIFSMDGDLAPLGDLVDLKSKFGAWLMVDEAHATGILGKKGRGGAEHASVESQVDISMGTLSKALGCVGGFICGSNELKSLLINRARSLIYSTGLPPSICREAAIALKTIITEPILRQKLFGNIKFLASQLQISAHSPIIPVMIGEEKECVKIAKYLHNEGIVLPAIRYPTVGRGKARLRISLSAAHTKEDLLQLAENLDRLKVLKSSNSTLATLL